jgi:Flp pilus assembly protein TadB
MNFSSVTHPATAWLVVALPAALSAAAFLIVVGLLRRPLALLLARLQQRRAARAGAHLPATLRPDPALVYVPEPADPAHLLAISAVAGAAVAFVSGLYASMVLAVALAALATLGCAWALLYLTGRRYVNRLERDLTAAVGRLSALLRAGSGFRPAVERVLADLPEGPLRAEWSFLLTRQGVPLAGGGIATPQQVVTALAVQTRSHRHATLLNHLGVAVGQPQDVLARRCAAAYDALQASDRRRDEALTELAQVRYSGLAVGLAGLIMAGYLAATQWERVVTAYSTTLGAIVGVVVLIALVLPIGGGMVLAQVNDVDY